MYGSYCFLQLSGTLNFFVICVVGLAFFICYLYFEKLVDLRKELCDNQSWICSV